MSEKIERKTLAFTHYETKEVREVLEPVTLLQFNSTFITAFMTSEEHCEDLPWYREVRDNAYEEVKAQINSTNHFDISKKAFYIVRNAFVKKYYPELAPKEKAPKAKKPEKLDMWNI